MYELEKYRFTGEMKLLPVKLSLYGPVQRPTITIAGILVMPLYHSGFQEICRWCGMGSNNDWIDEIGGFGPAAGTFFIDY